jgi:D-sedoheptulose 7-phosphate isomerase
MNNNYHINYFNSINEGLANSYYYINSKEVNPKLFFKNVNKLICNLRLKYNKIFFLGNGASSAFANHMALDFSKNGKIFEDCWIESRLAQNPSSSENLLQIF